MVFRSLMRIFVRKTSFPLVFRSLMRIFVPSLGTLPMNNKRSMYIPPFTVSADAINLIAEISAQIERYSIRIEQEDGLRLRKANRIKTIHSSLAIEGNTLSEDEVRDIIDGKNVVAKGLVHLAPPADRVPMLMKDLFDWLKHSKDHLLIRSCVFHYEFEFIHPFIDGNGRTGRLWQSLILGKLHPLFEHLPVENMVYSNQQQYYDAITASSKAGQSGPFIDFMLNEIYKTLKEHQGSPLPNTEDEFDAKFGKEFGVKFGVKFGANERKVLLLLASNPSLSAENIAEQIGLSKRGVEKQLKKFRDLGIITRKGSSLNPDKD